MSIIAIDATALTQRSEGRDGNNVPETNEKQKQVQTAFAMSEWNRKRLRENNIIVFGIPEV